MIDSAIMRFNMRNLLTITGLACLMSQATAQILTASNYISGVEGVNRVNTMIVSPDNQHLYAISDREGTLTSFSIDPESGDPDMLEVQTFAPEPFPENPAEMRFSPDGELAYISRLDSSLLQLYTRDTGTGLLTVADSNIAGLTPDARVISFVLSADGDFLYMTVRTDTESFARVYAIATDGGLTLVQEIDRNPTGIILPPDGRHLYFSRTLDQPIYLRNPDTGMLTLTENTVPLDLSSNQVLSDITGTGEILIYSTAFPTTPPLAQISYFNRNTDSGELSVGGLVWSDITGGTPTNRYALFLHGDQFLIRMRPHSIYQFDPENNQFIESGLDIRDDLTTSGFAEFNTQAITPDERFYYRSVADGITVFRIDTRGGSLIPAVPSLNAAGMLVMVLLIAIFTIGLYRAQRTN